MKWRENLKKAGLEFSHVGTHFIFMVFDLVKVERKGKGNDSEEIEIDSREKKSGCGE